MRLVVNWSDDPRIPKAWHVDGMRVADLTIEGLTGAGFTQAEAWSLYISQWHTLRSPLTEVVDAVLSTKAEKGLPLLPHERRELRRRMVDRHREVLARKGEAWIARWWGEDRLAAAREGTLCERDLEATAV